jgi:hypothetical protein
MINLIKNTVYFDQLPTNSIYSFLFPKNFGYSFSLSFSLYRLSLYRLSLSQHIFRLRHILSRRRHIIFRHVTGEPAFMFLAFREWLLMLN